MTAASSLQRWSRLGPRGSVAQSRGERGASRLRKVRRSCVTRAASITRAGHLNLFSGPRKAASSFLWVPPEGALWVSEPLCSSPSCGLGSPRPAFGDCQLRHSQSLRVPFTMPPLWVASFRWGSGFSGAGSCELLAQENRTENQSGESAGLGSRGSAWGPALGWILKLMLLSHHF